MYSCWLAWKGTHVFFVFFWLLKRNCSLAHPPVTQIEAAKLVEDYLGFLGGQQRCYDQSDGESQSCGASTDRKSSFGREDHFQGWNDWTTHEDTSFIIILCQQTWILRASVTQSQGDIFRLYCLVKMLQILETQSWHTLYLVLLEGSISRRLHVACRWCSLLHISGWDRQFEGTPFHMRQCATFLWQNLGLTRIDLAALQQDSAPPVCVLSVFRRIRDRIKLWQNEWALLAGPHQGYARSDPIFILSQLIRVLHTLYILGFGWHNDPQQMHGHINIVSPNVNLWSFVGSFMADGSCFLQTILQMVELPLEPFVLGRLVHLSGLFTSPCTGHAIALFGCRCV